MTAHRFVIIGAGSTVFTPGLLADLARSRVFDGAEIALVDIDADAARVMAEIGRRLASVHGSTATFTATDDRRAALPGADFVTTTIAVGGAAGWHSDVHIPLAHGIRQTVGDSVGPGGVLRALRHIPELVAIAKDVEELAPNAHLINYTNPLTANVRAIRRETSVEAVGLCHGTMHTKKMIARDLGLPERELDVIFAGINHFSWLVDVRHRGIDLYPQLREITRQLAEGGSAAPASRGEGLHQVVAADLLQTFGLYPAPGDRHISEFSRWYLEEGDGPDLTWGMQGGLDVTLEFISDKGDRWVRLREQALGDEQLDAHLVDGAREGERLVAICEAIATGRGMPELAVNVPNDGLVAGLPDWAIVEVPAWVDGAGVHGVSVPALPPGIRALLSTRAHQQELVVEAAVSGSFEVGVQALLLDPLVPSVAVARSMLRESIAAHAELLPQFA